MKNDLKEPLYKKNFMFEINGLDISSFSGTDIVLFPDDKRLDIKLRVTPYIFDIIWTPINDFLSRTRLDVKMVLLDSESNITAYIKCFVLDIANIKYENCFTPDINNEHMTIEFSILYYDCVYNKV